MINFPHLPPKSSSIKAHRWKQLVPAIIFIILVSALVSTVVSLSVVSWFLPHIAPELNLQSYNRTTSGQVVVDPILDRKIKQSLLTIYDSREKVGNDFYRDGARVAQAAILSSDGWAVVGAVGENIQARRYWEAVDAQGTVYSIEKFVTDSFGGLTYLKVFGEGFRVMALPQWQDDTAEQTLWAIEKEGWQEIYLDEPQGRQNSQSVFSIWQPQYIYQFENTAEPHSIILDTQGQLVGFVDGATGFIPSWRISGQLANLLAGNALQYQGLSFGGYIVQAAVAEGGVKPIVGFYVASSPTRVSSSTIGVGDVITSINHRSVNKFDLAHQVLSAPREVVLTVLRKGAEIDILVNKAEIKS